MARKPTEKEYRAFLRERKLTTTFKRYQTVKSKKEIQITQNNYDGSLRRQTLIVHKQKGYTVFRTKDDYKVVKRYKGTIQSNIKRLESQKEKVENFIFNSETNPKRRIQLSNTVTESRYIPSQQVVRTKTLTNKPPRKMNGGAIVDATYVLSEGEKIRNQTQSSFGFRVGTRKGKTDAVNDALRKGAFRIAASPVEVIIHDYWFIYYNDKVVSRSR